MKITAFDLAERFTGIKEVSGAMSNAQILAMLRLDDSWPQDDAVPWCFAGNVEILTEVGFMRFDQLKDNIEVVQVDPFLRTELVTPTRYVNKQQVGETAEFQSRDFGLVCDIEHRFLGVWNRANANAGCLELRPLKDLTSNLFIPTVATGNENDNGWTDQEIRLLAAFLSDGFVHKGRISIQVSKGRKIDVLKQLDPVSAYEAKNIYGISTQPLTTLYYEMPESFSNIFTSYKCPGWELLYSFSLRQLKLFVSTYAIFDGHNRGNSYDLYTSSIHLRDWLQTAVTLAGYHSSWREGSNSPYSGKPCYTITFCPSKRTRIIRPNDILRAMQNIDLFCVEVPSGVIVIRDPKGTVIPVGNCSAFVNYIAWLLRLPRSKKLNARSWLEVGKPLLLPEAKVGFDVVVFERGTDGVSGHVGFFAGVDSGHIYVLGGNQADSVNVSQYRREKLLGVRRLYDET